MPRVANRLHGLVVLEGAIMEQALIALELGNPHYAYAFRQAMGQGLGPAIAAARPFLGRRPWWYELLTALLSVELAMDEVKNALSLIRSHRAPGREDGRLLHYHEDHWIVLTTALLEKSEHLAKRVYRTLVKRLHPDTFNDELLQATARLANLRQRYASVRNPLLHPSGGPVTALEEDRLWEAHLLVGATVADVIGGQYDALPAMRQRWYQQNRRRTAVVLATIDAAFVRAAKDATTANTSC